METLRSLSRCLIALSIIFLTGLCSCQHDAVEPRNSTLGNTKEVKSRLTSKTFPSGYVHEYYYNDDGNLIRELIKGSGRIIGEFKNFQYEGENVLYKEYYEKDTLRYYIQYSYDGNLPVLISMISLNDSAVTGQNRQHYTYTSRGLQTSYTETYFDSECGLFKKYKEHNNFSYDNADQLISYDIHMERADGFYKFCEVEFTYDEDGNKLTQKDVYVYHNNWTFIHEWKYDDKNRLEKENLHMVESQGLKIVSYKENYQYDDWDNLLHYDACDDMGCRPFEYTYEYY